MYSHDSGKRPTDPSDRAHDHLAAAAIRDCPPEDIEATIRVLTAMAHQDHLRPLARAITRDPHGNPLTDTPEQRLAQSTWSHAYELTERLSSLARDLAAAGDNRRPS